MRPSLISSLFMAVGVLIACSEGPGEDLFGGAGRGNAPIAGASGAGPGIPGGAGQAFGGTPTQGGAPTQAGAQGFAGGGTTSGGAAAGGPNVAGESTGGASNAGTGAGGANLGGVEAGGASGGVAQAGIGGANEGGGPPGGAAGAGGIDAGEAGAAGSGGTGESPECEELREEAAELLATAQACNPLALRSCTGFVEDACDCPVPVNNPNSAASTRYVSAMTRLKTRCPVICPAVACPEPTRASCEGGLFSNDGICEVLRSSNRAASAR